MTSYLISPECAMTNLPPRGEAVWLLHYVFWPSEAHILPPCHPPVVFAFLPSLWLWQGLRRMSEHTVSSLLTSLFWCLQWRVLQDRLEIPFPMPPTIVWLNSVLSEHLRLIECVITQTSVLTQRLDSTFPTISSSDLLPWLWKSGKVD